MEYVVATSADWYPELIENLQKITQGHFHLINDRSKLSLEVLEKMRPRYIFFPHWSYLIPENIFNSFECVIFHMTDVPFGRGGSPLQNLISRGIYQTKISAIRCVKELDAGPVYVKKPLALYGTAQEIYMRAGKIIEQIILYIITKNPQPIPQQGKITQFTRRSPSQSELICTSELEKVFDHIRMLDADGYPRAYIETENLRFEFQRASLKQDHIIADVVIKRKEDE